MTVSCSALDTFATISPQIGTNLASYSITSHDILHLAILINLVANEFGFQTRLYYGLEIQVGVFLLIYWDYRSESIAERRKEM